MEKNNNENIIKRCILNIGILLIAFIINDILVTTVFQITNIPMSVGNVICACIITILIFILFNKKRIKKDNVVFYVFSIIITILIAIISTFLVGKTFDTSCDGNFYHKTAIGLIKEGWNPLYEESEEFCKKNDTEIEDKGQFLWIDHYPKVTWNFAASIYAITNNIESGKVLTVLLAISLKCITYSYFSDRFLKKWQAAIISITLAINPIVLAQIFTYYVDGIMGLLLYGIILFLIMITDKKYTKLSNKEKWLGLAAEIILCMNIKFTGIYLAAIFSIVFYIGWLIQYAKENTLKQNFLKITVNFIVIVIVGLGVVGASTYVKNIIDHKNPLYPIIGEDKVDIITTMQPKSFGEKNRFVKLFEATFSNSENITYSSGEDPKLKIPFSFNDNEINNLSIPDTRIGGYGIFFSGILVICAICFIYLIIKIFNANKEIFKYLVIIVFGVLITTFCMAEAWWARYSPQMYLIPIITIFGLYYCANINQSKVKKIIINIIGITIFILSMVNIATFIYWRTQDIENSKKVETSIYELKEIPKDNKKVEISLNENNYYGIIFNLRDYEIKYKLIKNDKTKEHYAYNYQILY